MFKSTDGSTHFSFTRFARNAIPNAAPAPIDTDLSPAELDAVFTHQLTQPNFLHLGPEAFIHAGITTSPKTASATHKALVKNGVLAPEVNTAAIGKNFAHDLAVVTSHVQKKVVNLLFTWEAEGERWVRLGREKEEAERVAGDVESCEKRVGEIDVEMSLKPSLRKEDGGQR
ncbi:hypothetical protein HBH98_126310 [Parastagonospora nodorum]|nr:hypothetical protein HBH53_120420 [Parastagonospora nodorum]KAH3971478.1 hypothetical protein HBH52_159020 [Parastagonospora nodorum]KAH4028411.1 hypothetical protein HBI09_136620 [Parastagonospora nodorum]KAH4345278.1 hypothetical protein HBH98_126310 [Parastagonospora nodorum]KAH4375037.1 hypothetical protein HBH97_123460 [Parastagonospora nodorum]